MDTVAGLSDAAEIELSLRHPERFAVIFDRYAAQIYRYAARRLGRAAADDLVGDVFLVAFRRRARYDTGRASARPWAQTVAQAPSAAPATKGQYTYIKEVYRVIQPNVGASEDSMTAEFWFRVGGNVGALGRLHFEYETGDVLDIVRGNGQTVVTQNGQVVPERTLDLPKWFRDDPDPSGQWLPDDEVATAPTNAADMLDFVRGQFPGREFDPLVDLLTQPILTPQQRAAVYEALGRLPDLGLVPDAVDATGRPGIGIVHDGPQRVTLIPDADSYQLLGYEKLLNFDVPEDLRDAPELQRGSGTAVAILDLGVVDSVDERP